MVARRGLSGVLDEGGTGSRRIEGLGLRVLYHARNDTREARKEQLRTTVGGGQGDGG